MLVGLAVSGVEERAAAAEVRTAIAGDDRGLGDPSGEPTALGNDAYVFREHSTANHERVDLRAARVAKAKKVHNLSFDALVRVAEWARSPRKKTSPEGIDRGVYQYRIYEFVEKDGVLEETGRWVTVQFVIEWGDGEPDSGWLVTAFPWQTQAGKPPQKNGKSWAPRWLANTFVFGPINNDILY